jgi:hypothetical protein
LRFRFVKEALVIKRINLNQKVAFFDNAAIAILGTNTHNTPCDQRS